MTIVQDALEAANNACSSTSRNQVCYGNILGQAVPASEGIELKFDTVGDIAEVTQIRALQLSPLNEVENEWGVALMQLQANLPDMLPGQNVTFLLFGDIDIETAVDDQVRVPALALNATNIRQRPTRDGAVLGALPRGTEVLATGKYTNSAGEVWLRVKFEANGKLTGWAFGDLLSVDRAALPDVEADAPVLNPMQAFYFRTGIGRSTCAEAPTTGVIVQTPEGVGLVNFSVNGVDIALGSTAYLNREEDRSLTVALLEGTALVQSAGVTRWLVPGSETHVPAGDDEQNSGVPSQPEPISHSKFNIVNKALTIVPRTITLPEPATPEEITRANPVRNDSTGDGAQNCGDGVPPGQCGRECNDRGRCNSNCGNNDNSEDCRGRPDHAPTQKPKPNK